MFYHGDIRPGFKSAFDDFVKNGVVLICERSASIVGVLIGSHCLDVDWEGMTAKIEAVVVDERFRRIGIGKKLVNRFIKLCRKQGCKAVKSRVNKRNMEAQEFHESLGFARADTYEYIRDFQT